MSQLPTADPREAQVVQLINSGRLDAAETLIKQILASRPSNAGMLNVFGCIAAQKDRHLDALQHFRRAHELAPTVADYADNLRMARELTLAKVQLASGDGDPKMPAALSDFAPELEAAELGTHVVIACMPKSGSTLLNRLLQALTGWEDTYFSFAFQQNEQELHLPYLREAARRNTITQQHFRATEANIQLLQAFAIKPLIQVRNLMDIVVSYTDFIDNGAVTNTFFIDRWERFERAERIDIVIDTFMPWYFAFYASWMDAVGQDRIEALTVSYEALVAAKPETVKRIADFYGLGKTQADCVAAVAAVDDGKAKTRFNKGGSGRGAEELSPAQKDRLARLAGYYPDVDFGPLGL